MAPVEGAALPRRELRGRLTLRLKLGPPGDFAGPGPWRLRRAGRPYEVRRTGDAGWIAIELSCRHQNADLTAVAERDGLLVCPRHGWRYVAATGACLDDPERPLRTRPVRQEEGSLWIIGSDNS